MEKWHSDTLSLRMNGNVSMLISKIPTNTDQQSGLKF